MAGAIAGIVAARAVMLGREPGWWALAIAALIAATALGRPAALRPLYTVWMRLALVLGWVNTRILLGFVFYAVLAPLGQTMRLAGRDALGLEFDSDAGTYAVPRSSRPGAHMRRQF